MTHSGSLMQDCEAAMMMCRCGVMYAEQCAGECCYAQRSQPKEPTILPAAEMGAELEWNPAKVDSELVRLALQKIQHHGQFSDEGVTLLHRRIISASRYAIEKLQRDATIAAELAEALESSLAVADRKHGGTNEDNKILDDAQEVLAKYRSLQK